MELANAKPKRTRPDARGFGDYVQRGSERRCRNTVHRAAEFRVAYHFSNRWAFGAGIEDPNQYIGSYVALPSAFTSIGSQFDNGSQIGAPNPFPAILSKLAYDRYFDRGRHLHAESVGLITAVQTSAKPTTEASSNPGRPSAAEFPSRQTTSSRRTSAFWQMHFGVRVARTILWVQARKRLR